ncbi:MAG: RNA polymerase sigma factor [Candidatus Zixiibacteriota bacterium]
MNINDLYKRVVDGENGAEEELFGNLSVRFALFIRQKISSEQDREEVIQKTLAIVSTKYKGIIFEKSFSAWAHDVLNKEVLKYYRSKFIHKKFISDDDILTTPPPMWTPDPILKQKLLDCMKKLLDSNQRYARAINLKYQGFLIEDICEKMKVTANNVYAIISRARSLLKHCLETGELD